jgi:hypothetical protein
MRLIARNRKWKPTESSREIEHMQVSQCGSQEFYAEVVNIDSVSLHTRRAGRRRPKPNFVPQAQAA